MFEGTYNLQNRQIRKEQLPGLVFPDDAKYLNVFSRQKPVLSSYSLNYKILLKCFVTFGCFMSYKFAINSNIAF